jgi:uncharacterized delta-60 repeat protein
MAAPGDLDPSFSGDGRVELGPLDFAGAVTVSADGGLIIAGSRGDQPDSVATVARYEPTGDLDQAWASAGVVSLEPPVAAARGTMLSELVIDGNGRILIAGSVLDQRGYGTPFLARLQQDGSMDPSFGTDGIATPEGPVGVHSLSLDGAGRIVYEAGTQIGRLSPDGSPDPTFQPPARDDEVLRPHAVAAADDGSVLVLGTAGMPYRISLVRLDENGARDPAFGSGGEVTVPFTLDAPYTDALSLDIDNAGRPVIGTGACTPIFHFTSKEHCDAVIRRYLPSGTRDTSFGVDGAVRGTAGSQFSLQEDGSMLAFGTGVPYRGLPEAFATTVLDSDGLRAPVGLGGLLPAYVGIQGGAFTAADVDGAGAIVAVGTVGQRRPHLMRFTPGSGPADADADGLGDSADDCPYFFSRRARGCRPVPRTLELDRNSKRRLRIDLLSPVRGCTKHQQVSFQRVRRGEDQVVATRRTSKRVGTVRVRGRLTPGRYYAAVDRKFKRRFGICQAAVSGQLVVRNGESGS